MKEKNIKEKLASDIFSRLVSRSTYLANLIQVNPVWLLLKIEQEYDLGNPESIFECAKKLEVLRQDFEGHCL